MTDARLDRPYNGFTLRTMLVRAAEIASEDDSRDVVSWAHEMREAFTVPGTPQLTQEKAHQFCVVIRAAADYQQGLIDAGVYDQYEGVDDQLDNTPAAHQEALEYAINFLSCL